MLVVIFINVVISLEKQNFSIWKRTGRKTKPAYKNYNFSQKCHRKNELSTEKYHHKDNFSSHK